LFRCEHLGIEARLLFRYQLGIPLITEAVAGVFDRLPRHVNQGRILIDFAYSIRRKRRPVVLVQFAASRGSVALQLLWQLVQLVSNLGSTGVDKHGHQQHDNAENCFLGVICKESLQATFAQADLELHDRLSNV